MSISFDHNWSTICLELYNRVQEKFYSILLVWTFDLDHNVIDKGQLSTNRKAIGEAEFAMILMSKAKLSSRLFKTSIITVRSNLLMNSQLCLMAHIKCRLLESSADVEKAMPAQQPPWQSNPTSGAANPEQCLSDYAVTKALLEKGLGFRV